MFHTLSNVQRGEAIPLQRCIDNREGRLAIWFAIDNLHRGVVQY